MLMFCCYWIIEVRGLHIVRVDVPGAVGAGTDNLLQCDYDLNGTSLYVLRWYKDDQEFFRFMPKESPAKRNFHVEGVHVNVTNSFLNYLSIYTSWYIYSYRFECAFDANKIDAGRTSF